MALLQTCDKHNEIVVNYLFGIDCPLCIALHRIATLERLVQLLESEIPYFEINEEL